MTNIRSIIKECVLKVLKEELSTSDHKRLREAIYSALDKLQFQRLGDSQRPYMEYYLNGFATVQCAVMLDQPHVHVERFYDNERFDGDTVNKQIPLPNGYDEKFINDVVQLCTKLKRSIDGDESIFGGIDDLEEINQTQTDRGTWSTAVGAPNSLARAKVEHPNAIRQIVSVLRGRFKTPGQHPAEAQEKLKQVVHDAATMLAARAFQEKWLVPLIVQAAEEQYWGKSLSENNNAAEDPKDAYYVEYHSQRANETPFSLSGNKFEYVNGKYPDGKIDIAVYAFAGDICYGYNAFRKMMNLTENHVSSYKKKDENYDAAELTDVDYYLNHSGLSELEKLVIQKKLEGNSANEILPLLKSRPDLTRGVTTAFVNKVYAQALEKLRAKLSRSDRFPFVKENNGRYAQLAGAEKVNEFLAKFGLGPNYKPSKPQTEECPKCKKTNARWYEEGADCDGGQNEMVLECPDCGYSGE